jgi:hypothetical protein
VTVQQSEKTFQAVDLHSFTEQLSTTVKEVSVDHVPSISWIGDDETFRPGLSSEGNLKHRAFEAMSSTDRWRHSIVSDFATN